ncbi:hypothetical protein BX616_002896, partial [Lobosporangium transversale]
MAESPYNRTKRIKSRPHQHHHQQTTALQLGLGEMPSLQTVPVLSLDSDIKLIDRTETMQSIDSPSPDHAPPPMISSESISTNGQQQQQFYQQQQQQQYHQHQHHHTTSINAQIKMEHDLNRTEAISTENSIMANQDSFSKDEPMQSLTPFSTATNTSSMALSGSNKSRSRKLSPSKKASGTTDDEDEFEMDESIQKSTIMIKRLRTKSESKKAEHEYGVTKDPEGDEYEQPAQKRQLQDHWKGTFVTLNTNQTSFPTDPRVYQHLPPPREDGGCIMCCQTYESPQNKIVLCDNCDRGFHQACYSPPIENKYVDTDLEWTCYACSLPLSTTSSQGLSALTEDMSLTGQQVPQDIKDTYLRSLSKSNLVKLIGRIEATSPAIKLYPSRLSSPTVPQADQSIFVPKAFSESLIPLDLAQEPGHTMITSPSYQRMQGIQSDYFVNSPLSSIQAVASTDANRTPGAGIPKSIGPFVFSGVANVPQITTGNVPVAQPATTNAPKHSGRHTPGAGPGPGPGISGAYHSVKAQDLPPYEEMIFMAIADLKQEAGSAPKAILDWVQEHFPVPETFRASCGQAISKAAKKGRLLKDGALYKLKPGYTYPRRVSRHTGSTRARSQSYNSALPLGVPPIDITLRSNPMALPYDQINTIIDANLYGMLPSPTFRMGPQTPGTPGITGNMVMGAPPRVQQPGQSFKFEPRPAGNITPGPQRSLIQDLPGNSTENKEAGVSAGGLIGLGVTTITSAFPTESDQGTDTDNTRRSSSMSSVSSGTQSFSGTFQGADITSARPLQTAQRAQQIQQTQQTPAWMVSAGAAPMQVNSVGTSGFVGTSGVQMSPNPLSIMTSGLQQHQQQGMYPGHVFQSRIGATAASPLQFTSSSFSSFGPITLPSQQTHPQSPQPHPSFPTQGPSLAHGQLAISASAAAAGIGPQGIQSGAPMYPSIFIPQSLQLNASQQHSLQQAQQQHPQLTQQQQQQLFTGAGSARLFGSMSLPASPQDLAPQILSSQNLFRDA